MMKYFDVTSSDKEILKRDILRDIIYTKAEELLVSKMAYEPMTVGVLDIIFDVPSTTRLTPQQIAEGAEADLQKLTFWQLKASMDKYQTRVLITDEAKARQIANTQVQMSTDAVARGMAYYIDYVNFNTLSNGAGLTQAATTTWNSDTADPATDIANALGQIITNTTLTDTDLRSSILFYPAGVFGHLAKPLQIGEIQQSIRNWAQKEYNIALQPTRMLTTTALAIVRSMETAVYMEYSGGAVPTAEQVRHAGVGDEYIITKYFKPLIIPGYQNGTTTKRICKITGVAS